MAAPSASRSWSTLARRSLVVGATLATALVALAVPASAHIPDVKAACKDGKTTLKIELTRYIPNEEEGNNTVEVTDNDEVLDEAEFATDYKKSFEVAGDIDHEFVVTVEAWDDKTGKEGWSFTKKLEVKACKEKPPTSSSTPTTTTTTEEEAPPAPPTTTTTEAPVGANANLAATGASIGIPIAIGALLLVGGATMLLVVRKRRRA